MESKKDFEAPFEKAIAKIEAIIRAYAPASIVLNCIDFLESRTPTAITEIKKHPWLILLLMKWTLTDRLVTMQGRPNIPRPEFIRAVNIIIKQSGSGRLPSLYDHPVLFMRALSFQQFPYQHDGGYIDLARQQELFAHADVNHFYHTEFMKLTGVSISDFILLSYITMGVIVQPGPFERAVFFEVCGDFPPAVVDSFLRAISIDLDALPEALAPFADTPKRPSSYLSVTPLLQLSPIIKIQSSYFSVHPVITGRYLGHFIYDKLKATSATKFQHRFGKTFEEYIGKLIKLTGLQFKTERQLKSSLPGEGKVVDFLIEELSARIFIDAKGVELAKKGMFTHDKDIAKSAVETSLLSAYEQGQATAARVLLSSPPTKHGQQIENYLIAVTYKELYIGNGESLALAIGDKALDSKDAYIYEKFGIKSPIPRDHIYFLTINEFEILARLVEDNKITFSAALERAKQADSVPLNKKFVFDLHIYSWQKEFSIVHPLKEKSLVIVDSMMSRIDSALK